MLKLQSTTDLHHVQVLLNSRDNVGTKAKLGAIVGQGLNWGLLTISWPKLLVKNSRKIGNPVDRKFSGMYALQMNDLHSQKHHHTGPK